MEKATAMVSTGSRMQIGGRKGGVMVMDIERAGRVRVAVQTGLVRSTV